MLGLCARLVSTPLEEVSTNIEEAEAKKVQLDDEVKAAITGRAEAKDAIAKATVWSYAVLAGTCHFQVFSNSFLDVHSGFFLQALWLLYAPS